MKTCLTAPIAGILLLIALHTDSNAQLGFPVAGTAVDWSQAPAENGVSAAALNGGRLVKTWTETSLQGFRRVRFQIVETDGGLLFPDDPPYLSSHDNHSTYADCAASSDGGAFFLWVELALGEAILKIQKSDEEGRLRWGEGGVVCIEGVPDSRAPRLFRAPEGGCLVLYPSPVDERRDVARAYDADGEPRQDWPEGGLISPEDGFTCVLPDDEGGFFYVHYPDDRPWMNRISPDGARVFPRDILIRPPEGNLQSLPNSFAVAGELLFALYASQWGSGIEQAAAVYNQDGEQVAAEMLVNDGPDTAEFSEAIILAGPNNTAFIIYGFYRWRPGWEEPLGPCYVMKYAPLEEERFPWGSHGVALPWNNASGMDLESLAAGLMGNLLVIISRGYIWGLTPAGEAAWGNQPTVIPAALPGYRQVLISNGEWLWEIAPLSYSGVSSCFRIGENGRIPTGEAPIHPISKRPTVTAATVTALLTSNRLSLLSPGTTGLTGNILRVDGELESPPPGSVISPDIKLSSPGQRNGIVDGKVWLWGEPPGDHRGGVIVLLDENNRIVADTLIRFNEERSSSEYIENAVDNGIDRWLFNRRVTWAGGAYHLYLYDLDFNLLYTTIYRNPLTTTVANPIRYWPGFGWLVLSSSLDRKFADLLGDSLRRRWESPAELPLPAATVFFEGDRATLIGSKYNAETRRLMAYWTDLDTSGRITSQFGAPVFPARSVSYSGIQMVPTSAGSVWLACAYSNIETHIQLYSEGFERMLPDSGFVVGRNARLTTDDEGGAWVFWESAEEVRGIHFDRGGRIWQRRYSRDGFPVFAGGATELLDVKYDSEADRVWVLGRRTDEVTETQIVSSLRVQLVGEEWSSIWENRSPPSSLSLNPLYPNPFNSSTVLTFQLERQMDVRIVVFDPLGRQVDELLPNRKLDVGEHKVLWNASGLAGGSYFIRLESSEGVIAERAVIVK